MTEVRTEISEDAEASSRPMRADAQRNHDKILAAAEEIFALDSVAVPIDIVAERAGVGVGTLYRHFPTKESLYEAIVTTRIAGLLTTADTYVDFPIYCHGVALDLLPCHIRRYSAKKQHLLEANE